MNATADPSPPDRSVRLMSEYFVDWPLWITDGPAAPDHFELSAGLTNDLLAWQELFEQHFHYRERWDDPAWAHEYERRGRELLSRLADELPGHFIELRLWPVGAEPVGSWDLGRTGAGED